MALRTKAANKTAARASTPAKHEVLALRWLSYCFERCMNDPLNFRVSIVLITLKCMQYLLSFLWTLRDHFQIPLEIDLSRLAEIVN